MNFNLGGGLDLPQQMFIQPPTPDYTWWVVGVVVPVVLAVIGWLVKR